MQQVAQRRIIYNDDQINFFNAIKKTRSNLALEATAGSGKTTSILEGLRHVPKFESSIFFSFSNGIVDVLKERVPSHIEATTIHSRGWKFVREHYKGRKLVVEKDKYLRLAIGLYKAGKPSSSGFLEKKEYRSCKLIQEVCNFARMTLINFNDREALINMCCYYNIEFDDLVLDYSQKLLKDALKVPAKVAMFDFADMIYIPAVKPEIVDKQYMNVFLDEAQDTNAAQLQLIEHCIAPGGRLISVGDSFQSIYGFSGADVYAFKRIQDRPDTIVLPLSTSYRCPKKVVIRAQEICPSIRAWEEAEEGEERAGSWEEIEEGDMVLSRTTKPLIGLYFQLLEKGIKARVIGKDFEAGLVDLVEATMSETFEGMKYNILHKFNELEQELVKMGVRSVTDHPNWRALDEKRQIIELLMKKVDKPKELVPLIHTIFAEDKKAARLMTIHRSKGLENDRVFLIEEADGQPLMPSKWAKQEWEHVQERNLIFVARTRAKKSLIFIKLNSDQDI